MGDGADMFLEQVEAFEDLRLEYHLGGMSDVEAYEQGIVDELGFEYIPGDPPTPKTCRCCGKSGLHWEQRNAKWRLFDERGIHNCPAVPLPEEKTP